MEGIQKNESGWSLLGKEGKLLLKATSGGEMNLYIPLSLTAAEESSYTVNVEIYNSVSFEASLQLTPLTF